MLATMLTSVQLGIRIVVMAGRILEFSCRVLRPVGNYRSKIFAHLFLHSSKVAMVIAVLGV